MVLSPDEKRRLATYVPPLLVGLLALPFALNQNAWWEWTNALWFLERQSEYVKAHGLPTYFLHTELARFYPFNVFYAGPTIALLAYPAAVFGAWPVFLATIVGAMVTGYVGIWWTARNLGLSHQLAILPAAAFALTPGLITVLYGQGAWAELVAVNAAALALGALTAMLWGDDGRRGRAGVVLAICAMVVTGTHNITLLLAAIFVPVAVAAIAPAGAAGLAAGVLVRRLGWALLATLIGVGVTGAWLVPNLWLASSTAIADPALNAASLKLGEAWVVLGTLLLPWPSIPPAGRAPDALHLMPQPPMLILAWTVVALGTVVGLRRRASDRLVASAAMLAVLGAVLLLLIVDPSWWLKLPDVLLPVQFTFRLVPYLSILISLGVVVALLALPAGTARRTLVATLVVLVGVQAVMAATLAIGTEPSPKDLTYGPIAGHEDIVADKQPRAFTSRSRTPEAQFRVLAHPIGRQSEVESREQLDGGVATADRDRVFGTASVNGDDRTRLLPVVWSPLIRVDGDASIAGRDGNGLVVVDVDKVDEQGRWSAVVRPRCSTPCLAFGGGVPWQLTLGGLWTVGSLLLIAGLGAIALWRRLARRGATKHAAPPPVDRVPAREKAVR